MYCVGGGGGADDDARAVVLAVKERVVVVARVKAKALRLARQRRVTDFLDQNIVCRDLLREKRRMGKGNDRGFSKRLGVR